MQLIIVSICILNAFWFLRKLNSYLNSYVHIYWKENLLEEREREREKLSLCV